jgi:hypothetical protein
MKVFFAASTSELKKYKSNYLEICRLIKDMGHTITRDWLDEAIKFQDQQVVNIDREDIYQQVSDAIMAADVVVVEGTIASFSIGHQITLALTKNKPVLFLQLKQKDKKRKQFQGNFIDGIKSPLLNVEQYTPEELPDILNDFFDKNAGKHIVKFNIVLTREIENYLNWVSFAYRVNRSEFIRELILNHMRTGDEKYQKYLEKGK